MQGASRFGSATEEEIKINLNTKNTINKKAAKQLRDYLLEKKMESNLVYVSTQITVKYHETLHLLIQLNLNLKNLQRDKLVARSSRGGIQDI